MKKILEEYTSLPYYKRQSWSVENYKRIFQLDSVFTEEQLEIVEEIFCDQIENILAHCDGTNTDQFDNYFQLENFYPAFVNKNVESGSWIRIKTDIGYNVYWAKNAPKKRMSGEQLRRHMSKIQSAMSFANKSADTNESLRRLDKIKQLSNDLIIAELVQSFPHQLKYVKIMKTRTKSEFLLPYQYEIISDINVYTAVIKDKMNQGAVKYRSYFTNQDKDQIFYLQSRGIDKDTAVLMCKLQQVYFVIDTQKLFSNWMQPA